MHRPDQLNLPDDPAFMPELDLDFNFSILDTPLRTSGRSSLMSPPSLISSRSSQQSKEEQIDEPALELPSIDTSHAAGLGPLEFGLGPGLSSMGRSKSRDLVPSVQEEETGIQDVGWEFDEYGNMIEIAEAQKPPATVSLAEEVAVSQMGTDSAVIAGMRQDNAQGLEVARQVSSALRIPSTYSHSD